MDAATLERLEAKLDSWLGDRSDAAKKSANTAPVPCGKGWQGTKPPGCTRGKKGEGKTAIAAKSKVKSKPTEAVTGSAGDRYLETLQGNGSRELKLKRYMREAKGKDIGSLKPEEYAALRYYTTYGYSQMNAILRGEKGLIAGMTEEQIRRAKLDNSVATAALKKLPAHTGVVYRGIEVPQSAIDSLKVGGTYKDKGFMSTSANAKRKRSGNLVLEIQATGSSGRDVSRLSSYKAEKEVIYPPGSSFKITGKRSDGRTTYVQLMEVPAKGVDKGVDEKLKPEKSGQTASMPTTKRNSKMKDLSHLSADQRRTVERLTPKQVDVSQISPERRKAFEDFTKLQLNRKWSEKDFASADKLFKTLKANGDITQAAALKDQMNRFRRAK